MGILSWWGPELGREEPWLICPQRQLWDEQARANGSGDSSGDEEMVTPEARGVKTKPHACGTVGLWDGVGGTKDLGGPGGKEELSTPKRLEDRGIGRQMTGQGGIRRTSEPGGV